MTSPGETDVFADILNLEDQYHQEGYELGVADGAKSGRIEGRTFGLEKGFEKFMEVGKLHGRAVVWEARAQSSGNGNASPEPVSSSAIPKLNGNDRLRKHIDRLAALTDPNALSTKNGEDEVSEFDDRLKDARAKTTLVARIVGEDDSALGVETADTEVPRAKALRVRRNMNENSVAGRRTGEMEDFLGLPEGRS